MALVSSEEANGCTQAETDMVGWGCRSSRRGRRMLSERDNVGSLGEEWEPGQSNKAMGIEPLSQRDEIETV